MKKLLIVDMQKGFINENNHFLIENIENLIKNCDFDKIYATKFVNHEDSQFVKFLSWERFCEKEEQKFAFSLPKDCAVLEKTSYSLWGGDLEECFCEDDEVYLCGTDYDACVLAIAFQLFDYGIRPFIVIDCVGSHSKNPIKKKDFEKICIKNFGKNVIKRINNGK